MSKSLEALRKIDEGITDLLTKFCWWSDIHFGKDNVWWANTTFIFLYPILDTLSSFFIDGVNAGILGYFFAVCLATGLVLYIANRFSFTKRIISNARKSPNKNKGMLEIYSIKIASFSSFFFLEAIAFTKNPYSSTTSSNLIFSLTMFIFIYFLCTDPIPPAVKRKKLEDNGLKTFQHKMQTVSNK